MQITFGRWVFIPHLTLTLLVLFFLPVLLGLSYWQWERAHEKQSMLDAFAISQTKAPVSLTDTSVNQISPYQMIMATGEFMPDSIFLLDNQMHEGNAGFDVLGVFKLTSFPRKRESIQNHSSNKMDSRLRGNDDNFLLINLGWAPRHTTRQNLPSLPALPSGKITLTGKAYFPSSRSLVLGTPIEYMPDNKVIIQKIDFKEISKVLTKNGDSSNIMPVVLLADPDPHNPLVRDWQPQNSVSPATHYGYAVQWLLLAITLCVLYLTFCIKRKTHVQKT